MDWLVAALTMQSFHLDLPALALSFGGHLTPNQDAQAVSCPRCYHTLLQPSGLRHEGRVFPLLFCNCVLHTLTEASVV